MKILEHKVTLESMTLEPLELIMTMGKKCWQSEPKRSAESFCAMILGKGHESVLEHASMSVSIITDRGITHEIVRHRIGCSYSQESTRFVKYDGDMEVMDQGLKDYGFDVFESAILKIEDAYEQLIDYDYKPQIARSVLPNALKADIGMTANFRAWRNFLKLRLPPFAHPSIRLVAKQIYDLLPSVVVGDICSGCGNKPYRYENGIIHNGASYVWVASENLNNPPPDKCFPLCKC